MGDKLAVRSSQVCAPGGLKACPLGTFEILDAFSCNLVHVRYGAKVKICEKTVMSAKSLVGIFNYKPTTLSDRRKANPGFTKCPFKLGL